MSGRSSARKGAQGELEVMSILRERGFHVERGGTQSYGARPDLYGISELHLEIKRAETARIWDWMAQSMRDAQHFQDGKPCVIFRRNRSNWMICLNFEDFLDFYTRATNGDSTSRQNE